MTQSGRIRCGIGGWTFEPWRGVFYPEKLSQKRELEYASRHLTTIEINGTYYSSFKPDSWAKWRESTPPGFRFSVKASRFCVNRKKFDYDDFAGFFDLLPKTLNGTKLQHVIEVRNATFANDKFVGLCRDHGMAICNSENENYPFIPDVTADFVYLRLLSANDEIPTGYEAKDLDMWADRFRAYAQGRVPDGYTPFDRNGLPAGPRDVYAYIIHEGKVRAPAAAMEFIKRVDPEFKAQELT